MQKISNQNLIPQIILAINLCVCFITSTPHPVAAQPNKGLQVVNYITWWSLDSTGYHPAILLKLENSTGRNLTGQPVSFQGRFMDLRTAQVIVARDKEQRQFLPKERILVWLKSPDPFELPLDVSHWPNLECKVMCRVASIDNDDATQTLTITQVDKVAMSDDDARQALEKMREYTQGTSDSMLSETQLVASTATAAAMDSPKPAHKTIPPFDTNMNNLPGLGDDFASFEKSFGLPLSTDAAAWTWASYNANKLNLTIHAGSYGKTGKVDILVIELPEQKTQTIIANMTKAFSGKYKAEKFSAITKSVRYLPQGRTELLTANTPGVTMTYVARGGTQVLILSRTHKEMLSFLLQQSKSSHILQPLQTIFEL